MVNKMKWFNKKFANVVHIIFRQFNPCQGLLTVCVCALDRSNAEMKMKSTSKHKIRSHAYKKNNAEKKAERS